MNVASARGSGWLALSVAATILLAGAPLGAAAQLAGDVPREIPPPVPSVPSSGTMWDAQVVNLTPNVTNATTELGSRHLLLSYQPDSTPPGAPSPLQDVLFDRVTIVRPAGLNFTVDSVTIIPRSGNGSIDSAYGRTELVRDTDSSSVDCAFADVSTWAVFATRLGNFTPAMSRPHFRTCKPGANTTEVTFSAAARLLTSDFDLGLHNFTAPTRVGSYLLNVTLSYSLSGLDHAASIPPLPPNSALIVTHNVSLVINPGRLDHLNFTDPPAATDADSSVRFRAAPFDAYGNRRDDPVTFALAPKSSGAIAANGSYTPDLVGNWTIVANASGKSASTQILVTPGRLDHVAFTTTPASTDADRSVSFAASAYDDKGNLRNDAVTFAVASGSGAVDGESGRFTPHGVGTTTLRARATAGGVTRDSNTSIEVSVGRLVSVNFTAAPASAPADVPQTFAANARDAEGNDRTDAIMFSVASGSGAINTTTGVFVPELAGNTTIRAAASSTIFEDRDVRVVPGNLSSLAFVDPPAATDADTDVTFAAHTYDRAGNLRDDAVNYVVANGSGTIGNATGVFTPKLAGVVTITASVQGQQKNTSITVSSGRLDHVAFIKPPATTDLDTPKAFRASGFDDKGNDRGDPVTFAIKNGSGTIDATNGTFTPGHIGTTNVTASIGARSATTTITVTAGAVDHVGFTSAPPTTEVGRPVTFAAVAYDRFGNARDHTILFSLRSGSGKINATSGLFTPNATGTSVIVAADGAKDASASIDVGVGELDHLAFTQAPDATNADSPVVFIAKAYDAGGDLRDDSITYSVVSGGGRIDPATGLFTPRQAGTVTIGAKAGNASVKTSIAVAPGAAKYVAFVQAPAATDGATPVTFQASAFDNRTNRLTLHVTYRLSAGGGSVDTQTGLFRPGALGVSTVVATFGNVSASANITVFAGPFDHVAFVTAPATTAVDRPVRFVASAFDSAGNARSEPVTYSLGGGSAGSIDPTSGAYYPASLGVVVIIASASGHTATTSLSVNVGRLDHIAFSVRPSSTDAETSVTFAASAYDAGGHWRDDSVKLSVVSGSGRIDANGIFTPAAIGTTTIQASTGSLTATTEITVVPGPLDHLAWTKNPGAVARNAVARFEAGAFDVSGQPRNDTVTYAVVDGPGSIDGVTGVYTSAQAGTAVIRASFGPRALLTRTIVSDSPPAGRPGNTGGSGTSAGVGTGGSPTTSPPVTTLVVQPAGLVATPYTLEFTATNATRTFTRTNGLAPVVGSSVTLTGSGIMTVAYWSVGPGGEEMHQIVSFATDGDPPVVTDVRFEPTSVELRPGVATRVLANVSDANLLSTVAVLTLPDGSTARLTLAPDAASPHSFSAAYSPSAVGTIHAVVRAEDRVGHRAEASSAVPLVVSEPIAKSSTTTPTSPPTSSATNTPAAGTVFTILAVAGAAFVAARSRKKT